MDPNVLTIGLPAGSLADPGRGGSLLNLLKDAGFPAKGYDKGGPSVFPMTSFVVGWDGRPQEFGAQLALGEVDIAIAGDDWIRERQLEFKHEYGQDIDLKKVLSLDRGKVRLVIIDNPEPSGLTGDAWFKGLLSRKRLVTAVSEMPYLTAEWFQEKVRALGFDESRCQFSVQKYKTPPRIQEGLVVYESWGKTEAKIKNGSVDFGMEITQSGSAIRNYGLEIMADVMASEAGVWTSSTLSASPVKRDMAQMFLLNLYGAIYAEDKVLVLFNAKKEHMDSIIVYLADNTLFADEPTVNQGEHFVEFSVQLRTNDPKLPLARVRYELAKLGATGIDTIPLESSIPGLDAVTVD